MFCFSFPGFSVPGLFTAGIVGVIVFLLVRRNAIHHRNQEVHTHIPAKDLTQLLEQAAPALKGRNHGLYHRVHLYTACNKEPTLVLTEVANVTSYKNGPVVVIAGHRRDHYYFHLGDADFLIALGEPSECQWANPSRVRIWREGLLLFDAEISAIDSDVFSTSGFGGYLEDGSDIFVVAGKNVTILHEYPAYS